MPPKSEKPDWKAAVLTVSDRSSRGERPDLGGPQVAKALARAGFRVAACDMVPDEKRRIAGALRRLARDAALVVTTGGTGIAPRDVTPEATRQVLDKELPGFGEAMRSASFRRFPHAALSRATAGTLGRSLVVNLPGNPSGAVDCLSVVLPAIPHALNLIQSPACDAHR